MRNASAHPHIPVLYNETLAMLSPKPGEVFCDATAGAGGHAKGICGRLGASGRLILIDADADALSLTRERLAACPAETFFFEGNFKDIAHVAREAGVKSFDGILFDLGISSMHLERSGRGFSFLKDEPLRMTLGKEADVDARDVVNTWSEESLRSIISAFGQERFAARIARAIAEAREKAPIATSRELAEIVARAVPRKRGRIHPATKTFQAIRIAVNEELLALEHALPEAFALLGPAGRMVVISFHSLEDGIVKRFFREKEKEGTGFLLSKKPVVPAEKEIAENPRARSAKLRGIAKKS